MKNEITANDWRRVLLELVETVENNKDRLNELDGMAGDGDHGVTLSIGYRAVRGALAMLEPEAEISRLMQITGRTFLAAAGGAVGPLLATLWLDSAKRLAGVEACGPRECREIIQIMESAVARRGKAQPGDKTMLDALHPAADAVRAEPSEDIAVIWRRAAEAAENGAAGTSGLQARIGRAARLGERSVGFADAGATSIAMTLRSIARSVERLQQEVS